MKKSNITQAKARINELMENTINTPTQNLNEMFSEAKKLDKVGTADADIDNDGDVDNSDVYLHNRRRVIKKSIKSEEISPKKLGKITVDTDEKRSIRAKMWRAKKSGDNASWNKLNAQLTVLSNTQKESVDEEALDEISKAKLRDYERANEKHREKLSNDIGWVRDGKYTPKQRSLLKKLKSRNNMDMLASKKGFPRVFTGKNAAKVAATEEVERIDEISKDKLYTYFKASYADEVERRGDAIDQKRSLTPAEKKLNAKRNLYRTKAAHKISPIPDEVKNRGKAGKRADKSDARMQFKKAFKKAFKKYQKEEMTDTGATAELTEKSSFGKAFAAARALTGGGHVFSWNGKKYTTNIKGETGTVAKGNYNGAPKPAPKPASKPAPTPVNKIAQGTNRALSKVTRPMPRTPTQGNNPSVTGRSIRPRANPRTAPIAKPRSLVPDTKITGPTPINPGKSIARATAKALAVTPKTPNRTSTGAGSALAKMGAAIKGTNSPTAKLNEASIDYKVSVDGLPPMFIDAKNPMEIKQKLRKLLRKPDSIGDVKRVTKSELKKYFRTKGMGKDPEGEETKNG